MISDIFLLLTLNVFCKTVELLISSCLPFYLVRVFLCIASSWCNNNVLVLRKKTIVAAVIVCLEEGAGLNSVSEGVSLVNPVSSRPLRNLIRYYEF